MKLDEKHQEVDGQLINIEFDNDSQTRADVTFAKEQEETDDLVFDNYRTWRFGLTQLLKFAGVRKSELKEKRTNDEGNDYYVTRDDAKNMVLEGIEEDALVFKFKDENMSDRDDGRGELLSVVSENYTTIPSARLDDIVNETLGELGITGDDMTRQIRRRGFVVEIDYRWDSHHEVEEVNDVVDGGISIRNSVFGASSLRVNKFYTILACQNGMRIRDTERTFNQIHMGDRQELEDAFRQEVKAQFESIWEETELIKTVGSIEFELEDQIEFVEELMENGKITKRSGKSMIEELEKGEESEWNLGRDNAWNIVNAFTGYTTHSDMVSTSSAKDLERVYDRILKSEDKEEVLAVAE